MGLTLYDNYYESNASNFNGSLAFIFLLLNSLYLIEESYINCRILWYILETIFL